MNKIIIICGPTAVGKTAYGIDLCKKQNGEIVSADSQQVYRGMDIGTAKEDLTDHGVKCHLIDIVNPDEPFDASKFMELADAAITDICGRGKLPFVVGGTGLYIKTLLYGLSDAPSRDEDIRAELRGREDLHEILAKEDPIAAKKLHRNDKTRIIRAIEVMRLTGRSVYDIHESHEKVARYEAKKIGLNIPREELYDRINDRVDKMVERGLVLEVKGLVEKYGADIQSLKAVGYKEIVEYLKGNINLEKAIYLTKLHTRHFAKRQLTWFRADGEIEWI